MDSSDSPVPRPFIPTVANPFLAIKSRYWVFGGFLLAVVLLRGLNALLRLFPAIASLGSDPISVPLSTFVVLSVIAGLLLWVSRRERLRFTSLFGQRVPQFSLAYGALLIGSLLLFSLGASSVVLYLLSLQFPSYVEQLLNANVLFSGAQSAYPRLYEGFLLFLLVIYAPLVEELIFRGFLLQRWGAKWGLRWGLVLSSGLFGALHVSNPAGLTIFGLVMGLLYLRTRSLWVPIGFHALNNLAAVGIEHFTQQVGNGQPPTVADIQALWWVSLMPLALSLPFLSWFVWCSWPKRGEVIPYVVNAALASGATDGVGLMSNGSMANGLIANGLIANGSMANGSMTNGSMTNDSITTRSTTNGLIANNSIKNGSAGSATGSATGNTAIEKTIERPEGDRVG
jgi:uncharacterized protein